MQKRRLGKTGMVVSDVCMGTMTFGSQCDEKTSFDIMDAAVDFGIDFFDTAEVYPVPPAKKWVHRTEEMVGKWLKGRPRESIILATKVAGPGHGWFHPPLRTGRTAVDRVHIRRAIEGSLKRLQTDYIDLYQVHWPDHDFGYHEILEELTLLMQQGVIRAFGCSNENAWGLMKSLHVAEHNGLNRYETIQNNFSLLNRRFEDELAEISRREQVSLLPYSPLAGGVLSGKYNNKTYDDNARFARYMKGAERQRRMASRFLNEKTLAATEKLMQLAQEINVSVSALALQWSKKHDYVASTIVGATTVEQLKDSLSAPDLIFTEELDQKIDAIHQEVLYPMD